MRQVNVLRGDRADFYVGITSHTLRQSNSRSVFAAMTNGRSTDRQCMNEYTSVPGGPLRVERIGFERDQGWRLRSKAARFAERG